MSLRDYLTDHAVSLALFLLALLAVCALLWLIETPGVFIAFASALLLAAGCASLLWDYARRRGYYRRLLELLDRLDQKALLSEVAPRPHFLDGQILLEILRRTDRHVNDRLSDMQREGREYREYLDTWVHEIKTPLASARLMVENDQSAVTLRIDDELAAVERLVEQVLYYARSTAAEKDFRVEKTTLHALVSAALRAYSKPVIQAGGRVHMEGLDVALSADVKLSAFVIGQILSNAVKYRREALMLRFSAHQEKNAVLLRIEDNGIGIPAADLSRVFDKGFTGENGRRFPKSTGIGLYLCKRLCDGMHVGIRIESAQGRGTAVTLRFPSDSHIRGTGL